jgi:purine-binding chemotaxis protein CheW
MNQKTGSVDSAVMEGASRDAAQRAGKFLTFKLAREEYGLEILKVKEIFGLMSITKVPRTPDYILGVINLRGKVIPVIDLRSRFSMDRIESTNETCIIVVDVKRDNQSVLMGILVDGVSEVLDISADEIEDTPSFGGNVDTEFILGMGKAKDRVIMLLDIDKVMTSEDLKAAEAAIVEGVQA